MNYNEEFIKSLPKEPNEGIVTICQEFRRRWSLKTVDRFDLIIEGFALISTYSEAYNLGINVPQITRSSQKFMEIAQNFISQLITDFKPKAHLNRFIKYKSEFATSLGTGFYYEFSEGDLELIQRLINELRKLISATKKLEEDHRHRLINKLEKVQSELHKKVSNLDRFWGFCIDASIVAGLMGKNAEPMFDLVKKIVAIIWPAQTRAYELPSSLPFKLLGQAEDDKS